MNPKRNHHVLPKLYLKGFVDTNGGNSIWEFEKGKSFNPGTDSRYNPQLQKLKKAGMIRDYYAVPNAVAPADFQRVENVLEQLEKPADLIFEKIRSRQKLADDDKKFFSLYIYQTLRRVPSYRERVQTNLPGQLVEIESEIIEESKLTDPEQIENLLAKLRRKIATPEYSAFIHLDNILRLTNSPVIDIIAKMNWCFYTTSQNQGFATSDNPVFFFRNCGLQRLGAEVSFPISSTVCLVASNHPRSLKGYQEAKPQVIKELNRRVLFNASQFAFYHRGESWVQVLLNKNGDKRFHPIATGVLDERFSFP